MPNLNEKIAFEIGIPITVAFAYEAGRLCSKRWPGAEDCYARQTKDGRVLFVDAAEEMRLRKTVRAGQPVILCREKTNAGAQYLTIKTAPELNGPLAVVNGHAIPETKYATPETPINGNGHAKTPLVADGQPISPVAPPSPVFPEYDQATANSKPVDGGLLGRCLMEALDACKVAQAHAAAIGLPTVFGAGEVERMAVSLLIERLRNGSAVARFPVSQARSHHNGNSAGAQRA